MGSYRVISLPGDGIGPEVMDSAVRVLKAVVANQPGLEVTVEAKEAGANHYRRTNVTLPDSVVEACLEADAVLLSAIGLPDVRKPDGTEVQPDMMVGLRRAMQLHSAVRPCKLYPGVRSPLSNVGAGIDFVIIRENLEGLFASFGGGTLVGDSVATDTLVITRDGTQKVTNVAFQVAKRRKGRPLDGRSLVTCVDKANIFRSMAFFRKVFFDVAKDYPTIATDCTYVDAMSLYLVQNPAAFDVMVMENQFGDILSDLGAGLVGGLGLAPSAEIGDKLGLFQPSHGSAPSLAGKNVANPLAMILSVAMMFDWLADQHDDDAARQAGLAIETAVARVLTEGHCLTADLGGSASTSDVGSAVIKSLS